MSTFIDKNKDLKLIEVFPGITGHLVHTEACTIGDFYLKAGTELPVHQHPHEQTSTILEGDFEFTVDGTKRICRAGDVAVMGSNVPHSGIALTDCRIIDVFHPVREDYRALATKK
ncbi:cupin domain-containing protein [Neolewinella antarctica]|uniref:Quercetin dioxygenase-like cupin family protein n=1 Tax=Neolewinella antarctica TaxID=442734 RepID=A0ABX0XI30_9BACT|nr:cupin domain-containing protein [Neolewinella antarctica]NJC28483.1 quercetin dioxygenase-like cupin family protein [Neolewinella antarctica]